MDNSNVRETDKNLIFNPPAKILAVDDSRMNLLFIVNAFNPPNFILETAMDAVSGIEKAKSFLPEVIFLDIMMPEIDGYEAARQIHQIPELAAIPIIFITALDSVDDKLRAFDEGAVDYVTKPFNHRELIARVKVHVSLSRAETAEKELYRIALSEHRQSAIAKMAAGVSHNFNNMLGSAYGNLLLLEMNVGDKFDEISKSSFNDIKKSFERMQNLLKQFLMISQQNLSSISGDQSPAQKVFISQVITDVISNIMPKNEDMENFDFCQNQLPPDLVIWGNFSHVSEIFHLIIDEIMSITAGSGKMCFSYDREQSSDTEQCIVLDVFGLNIPKEVEDFLFDPFSLPIASVGSGLSFSIAHQLILADNASVKISILENQEVKFQFFFPLPIHSKKEAPSQKK